MTDNTLFELVNVPQPINFAGKTYNVKKANLEKAILYQTKVKELAEKQDGALDLKLAAYCLYLVLKDVDASITESFVIENLPGDLDSLAVIQTLGFMSPQKRASALK